ncbi:hypothetical protein GCM10009830_33330 [Glycomyces endophyticus]|uniref:HD domain-containing protein n=1 Tax=Glycomyces endophyticus TaxID=480996 RepID=A0ABP4T769_9ACTN
MSYFQPVTDARLPFSARLSERILRLRHITGFVSVYGERADRRTAFFARYWHVQRVLEVAMMLVERSMSVDARAVERLAWTHDLNRWPFAHNSERGRFDQVANIDEYFGDDSELTGAELRDLKGINAKEPRGISDEARIVLLADVITGMVEDPLFAVIGLNVHPELIPPRVDDLLGYSLGSGDFFGRCRELAEDFHHARVAVAEDFSNGVRTLFRELVERFLKLHCQSGTPATEEILGMARDLRSSFMRKRVFPINNGLVCHAELLLNQVIPWYLDVQKGSSSRLLAMTEEDFVAEVTRGGAPFRAEQFVPDLDVMVRQRPERPFIERRTVRVCRAAADTRG